MCRRVEMEGNGARESPYDVVLLGGFSGRLDQTVHLLSYLHKLRKSGRQLFVVTDESVGWVLDEARGFPRFDNGLL
jgi:thiamine pyrophosphokinase